MAYVLAGMGSVMLDRGDLAGARHAFEQSLAIRNQIGEKQNAGETQLALARVAIENGQAAAAEGRMRELRQQFHLEQQSDDELTASTALMSALLAQGKQKEAEAELKQTRALAGKTQNLVARLAFDTVAARVTLATGSSDQPRAQLASVLSQARAHHLPGLALEAQLATAEAEGHTTMAQQQLASIEKAANSKGFGLIARKAAKAAHA